VADLDFSDRGVHLLTLFLIYIQKINKSKKLYNNSFFPWARGVHGHPPHKVDPPMWESPFEAILLLKKLVSYDIESIK